MDAVLLVLECIGILLVLKWVATGKGEAGLFAWKPQAGRKPQVTGR